MPFNELIYFDNEFINKCLVTIVAFLKCLVVQAKVFRLKFPKTDFLYQLRRNLKIMLYISVAILLYVNNFERYCGHIHMCTNHSAFK